MNTCSKILGQYPRDGKRWQIDEETARQLEASGRLEIVDGVVKRAFYPEDDAQRVTYNPFWSHLRAEDVGTAQSSKEILNSIMGEALGFDTVKPPALIEELIRHLDKDSIVLDSFAGSGTTAHAVLNLNAADGGTRKFILVEMEDYAERITAERVRRVIGGYGNVAGTGGSFDFYEVGEPLMIDGDLNAAIDEEQIRAYIWHEATGTAYRKATSDNPAYLGEVNGTAYYFVRGELNAAFISTLAPADSYVIYGTESGYNDDELRGKSITFKKIPRNINEGGAAQ